MRLKEFIIFIIIFTILYFGGLALYDYYKNKKDEEKNEEKKYSLLDIEKLKKFALFYNTNITIDINILTNIYQELKNVISFQISSFSQKYNISKEELIVIVEYLEYVGLLKRRAIHLNQDVISDLDTKEDALVVKYSILFSNQYDYNTILNNAGFGADKEVALIIQNHLIPGVRIEDSKVYYVGDLDE